ncbi:MAG: YihA family ribosome biogenesis GTP-binding protein [Proteobacteria bacterium]|nr:YihA family ribosome biogenesis GTP-binding protein [Pseudomonadota bacterium]
METQYKIFSKPCEFQLGVVDPDKLPATGLPEVAFIGRSNVGKSSLINAILGRRVARTSGHPGHTRQLNFFLLDTQFYIVDMPGYGYAAAPKSEIARWRRLINNYLQNRASLRRLYILVDSRHGLKPSDIQMLELVAQYPVSTQIIFTKVDKVAKSHLIVLQEEVQKQLQRFPMCHPEIIAASSENRTGLEELRASIVGATGL